MPRLPKSSTSVVGKDATLEAIEAITPKIELSKYIVVLGNIRQGFNVPFQGEEKTKYREATQSGAPNLAALFLTLPDNSTIALNMDGVNLAVERQLLPVIEEEIVSQLKGFIENKIVLEPVSGSSGSSLADYSPGNKMIIRNFIVQDQGRAKKYASLLEIL